MFEESKVIVFNSTRAMYWLILEFGIYFSFFICFSFYDFHECFTVRFITKQKKSIRDVSIWIIMQIKNINFLLKTAGRLEKCLMNKELNDLKVLANERRQQFRWTRNKQLCSQGSLWHPCVDSTLIVLFYKVDTLPTNSCEKSEKLNNHKMR